MYPFVLYRIFPHYLIKGTNIEKVIKKRMCVLILLYNFCLRHFSLLEELSEIQSKMVIGFHVRYPLFLSDCN